jgi:simple sugar transport system ATP-binding protein
MMQDKSLIKMLGITKSFPGVVATEDVDFDLHAGEIHSILGENGAGKTTLMNILSGMYQPDKGNIIVRGQTVRIRSPQDSLRLGIGMVYQHFTLIPNLTVLENLILGFEGGFFLDLKQAERKLQQISETYGLSIDPQTMIQDLSVGERQRTEILKILYHESGVLILDEPTSVLSPAETESLFYTLKLLRNDGKSVILITHNLNEALEISDRITIMRSGRKAAELTADTLTAIDAKAASDKILDLMFGTIPQTASAGAATQIDGDPRLELNNVEVLNSKGQIGLKRISFKVRKGEIVGITGVAGEDQRLLAEVIGGQKRVSSGSLRYRGRDITRLEIAKRFELGISYITADRINEGCVLDMALSENSILQSFYRTPFSRFGILNRAHIGSFTTELINRFGIRAGGPEALVRTLSGGNIQKLILARGLSGKPGLIICNSPTYGLDTKTVHFIQDLLKAESRRGTAVLLITSDMDELFSCSNRIGVLFNGEIIGLMDRREATPEKVGKLMLGVR